MPTPTQTSVIPKDGPFELHISAWTDPVIDTVGHDPRSAYVERFWLGVLGPSAVLLFRRLAVRFDQEPDGFRLDLASTAAALGLAANDRRNRNEPPILRSIERSCLFGMARRTDEQSYLVRTRFPPLTRRQLERLPEAVQREHRQWSARDARRPAHTEMRRRARRLALSLIELGETYDGAERQLHRWRFHPAVAHDAVKWAHAEHLGQDHEIETSDARPLRSATPVITRLAAPTPAPTGGDAA